jgi:cell fate regulator YaaT (PSP1 superfamily)
MPKIAKVEIAFWDQAREAEVGDFRLELGDQVIIKYDNGNDIGKIIGLKEISEQEFSSKGNLASIIRKITTEDLEAFSEIKKQKPQAIEYCKKSVERYQLPMKIIDAHFSFDGSRLFFPFIADGRVDFRQLVKDLTHHFQKSIRLQQIGIRDEARISGDLGSCGRNLCCKTHLRELESITSEYADVQQISHRGSDRLSGICGRLRCCLAFEKNVYEEAAKILPPIGSIIKTEKGKGKVISWNTLKSSVEVVLDNQEASIIEVPFKIN